MVNRYWRAFKTPDNVSCVRALCVYQIADPYYILNFQSCLIWANTGIRLSGGLFVDNLSRMPHQHSIGAFVHTVSKTTRILYVTYIPCNTLLSVKAPDIILSPTCSSLLLYQVCFRISRRYATLYFHVTWSN